MKNAIFNSVLSVAIVLVSVGAPAAELPGGHRLAETKSITAKEQFPTTKITVVYVRACSERLVDILTRSQLAAGKNYLEVGALVEETNKPCQMNEPPILREAATLQLNSELPLVLFALDLSIDIKAPIKLSGASVQAGQASR